VLETYTTANTGGSLLTSITVNKPSGAAVGDLLIAFMTGTNGTTDWATLAGWTMINEVIGVGDGRAAQYRIVDGTEGATFIFSATSSGGRLCASIVRISGADNITPINAQTLTSDLVSPSSPENCTAITTTVDGCLGIVGVCERMGLTTKPDVTFPTSGWTQVVDFSGGSYSAMAIGQNTDLDAAGSKACQIAWTGGAMSTISMFLIGINPA